MGLNPPTLYILHSAMHICVCTETHVLDPTELGGVSKVNTKCAHTQYIALCKPIRAFPRVSHWLKVNTEAARVAHKHKHTHTRELP